MNNLFSPFVFRPLVRAGMATLLMGFLTGALAQDDAAIRKERDRALQELRKVETDFQDKQPAPKKTPMKSVDEALAEAGTTAPVEEVAPAVEEPAPDTPAEKPKKERKKKKKEPVEEGEATPAPETKAKTAETPPPVAAPEAAPAEPTDGDLVVGLTVRGDADLLDLAAIRRDIENQSIGRRFTRERADQFAAETAQRLHNAGYVFASATAAWPLEDGRLALDIDAGRFGASRLFARNAEPGTAFTGRYFSPAQIERRLASLTEGAPFDYAALYNAVYRINAHPDLTADVDLKPRTETVDGRSRRLVDMDFSVEDDLPLHATLELSNNGTDVTDEWGASLTLQYLNVSRRDDVFTLSLPFSIDLESIRSVSAGYYLPHRIGKGGSVSVFGGYSELSADSVVDQIGLEGEGWFAGVQSVYNLFADERHAVNVALGISHSVVTDNLVLNDQPELDREVSITPLLLVLAYYSVSPDAWGGLNSASLAASIHSSSFPGASDDEEFEAQRENAVADYLIARLFLSRLQPVFTRGSEGDRDWTLFGKLEGQYASEPLIPSEQKGLGGYDTVRGYIEREYLGDDGVNASLELRTPFRRSSALPRWFKRERPASAPAFEQVQGLVFLDGGYISLKDALAGEEESETLASVGLGFRLGLGDNAQMRFDWGFPLVETEDSDTSGRGHISLQLLF
jgi:hemolysin activation/secretion protein